MPSTGTVRTAPGDTGRRTWTPQKGQMIFYEDANEALEGVRRVTIRRNNTARLPPSRPAVDSPAYPWVHGDPSLIRPHLSPQEKGTRNRSVGVSSALPHQQVNGAALGCRH